MSAPPRVLVVHNRYRIEGGEERSVDLQLKAMEAGGIDHAYFERRSTDVSKPRAARALIRGGHQPDELAEVVRESGANVVHVHNVLPLIGPKGLAAAREAGARVVMHLHNVRIFCATGFGERDGGPCRRCRGRNTLPGLVLNCRRSLPEAVAYAEGLARHQPLLFRTVDRFVVPSAAARDELEARGLPAERVDVLRHYLPAPFFADRSQAAEGEYALVASRLSPEKGTLEAVESCAAAGVPLRVAGEGPEREAAEQRSRELGADVTFLGRLSAEQVKRELSGAAMVLMPSRYHEFSPFSALEAMAQGVPLVATAMGGLPELLGEERCIEPGVPGLFAERIGELWQDPELRGREGGHLLDRALERHGQSRYAAELRTLYEGVSAGPLR